MVAADFGSVEVGLVFQEVLPNELDERKARVFLEQSLRKCVGFAVLGRVAPVENQVHVFAQFPVRVLAEREKFFAEILVLDDFFDVQTVSNVVLRK